MSTDDQSYNPSAKIKLGIRFDEMARRVFDGKLPPKPLKYLSGVKDPAAPLMITDDPTAPAGSRRHLLSYDPTKGTTQHVTQVGYVTSGPQKQVSSADGLTHVLAGIIPREATLNLNGIRTADTLSVTIRYIDCPIDPRTVRASWIEFYLGNVPADDFAAGIDGQVRTQVTETSLYTEPMNLIDDTWEDDQGRIRTNLRFQGFVDEWENEWDDSGQPVIRLECRDNTQLPLDVEAPARLMIDAKIDIDLAVAQYLAHFPQFAGLSVEYRPGNAPDIPQLQTALSKTAYRPLLGPTPGLAAGQPSGLMVWDFLTDVCGSVGHTVRMDGTNILIERARTLYNASGQGPGVARPDDPFTGRDGNPFRRMIWGRNVKRLTTKRSFVKKVPTNIEVRSWDPLKKQVAVGRYPTNIDGSGIQSSIPGDGGAQEKWLVWKVREGVTDIPTLRIIAQNIYEQLGRQELFIKIKTRNLASFGAGGEDPDLLDMKAADTIEILIDRSGGDPSDAPDGTSSTASSLSAIEAMLTVQERNVELMQTLGFDEAFSTAYSKVYTDLGFQTAYRVQAVTIAWTIDDGVTFDIDAINYVEVRADPTNLPYGDIVPPQPVPTNALDTLDIP